MDYSLTKNQVLVQKSIKEFLQKECPKDKVRELKEDKRGYDPKTWKKMVQLGYVGLIIPEEYGGTEDSFLELMIMMEEIGRNIFPSPYFATVALCTLPIIKFGTRSQKETYLPKIAQKGDIWTLAASEGVDFIGASNACTVRAMPEGSNYVLNGTKMFVPYATEAGKFLVIADFCGGQSQAARQIVLIVDAGAKGIDITPIPTTAHDNRCEVKFNDVMIGRDDLLGGEDDGARIVDYILRSAAVLKAAEMSGGAQAVLEITRKYAQERVQFGKPIGSFQTIQHRLVDRLCDIEGLKFLVHKACWAISHDKPSGTFISMAKAKANEVYHRMCFDAIVIHGAIGWTEEMDVSLYHIRTKALCFDGGSTDFHLEQIANQLDNYTPAMVQFR